MSDEIEKTDGPIPPPPTNMQELLERLAQPLAPTDIRKQDGKEYVSGGDVLYNLWRDFGALNVESHVARLEWTEPRYEEVDVVDKRTGRPEIDKDTGEVKKRGGWSCAAVCVVRVTLRMPSEGLGFTARNREGVGAASSFMQGDPETAIENATKSAETDGIKRACVGLGPRYGLALRFKDRDDDRVGMGLIARNEKVEAARAAREKNKGAAQPSEPQRAASAAGSVPAAVTPKEAEVSVGAIAELAGKLIDECMRQTVAETLLRHATNQTMLAKIRARVLGLLEEQVGGKAGSQRTMGELVAMIADERAREAATAAIKAAPDSGKLLVIRKRVITTLIKQLPQSASLQEQADVDQAVHTADPTPATSTIASAPSSGATGSTPSPSASSTPSAETSSPSAASPPPAPEPSPTPERETVVLSVRKDGTPLVAEIVNAEDRRLADAPAPEWERGGPVDVPGHGRVYGMQRVTPADKEAAVAETNEANYEGGGVDDADAAELAVETTALRLHALVNGDPIVGSMNLPDPSLDDLSRVGWGLNFPVPDSAKALELLKIPGGQQVPQPMQDAVVGVVKEMLGRDDLYKLWKALGMPTNKSLPIAHHVRLLAYVTAARKWAECSAMKAAK